ncbi:MAG: hypothetical protein ACK4SZ_03460 [Allosphingosinicella sp.]|uniref:hypothetical protein n=1 Tax=Allosphingosinicella sp. TaxID=2823234 RepID=UPI0039228229
MPTPDIPSRRPRRRVSWHALAAALHAKRKRRPPGKDHDPGGVPVEPDSPRDLSGGAAAPLDFEDE